MGSRARLCVSAVIQHQGTGPPVAIREQVLGGLLRKGCLELRRGRLIALGSQEALHGHFRWAIALLPVWPPGMCSSPGKGGVRGPPEWRGPGGGDMTLPPSPPASSPPHQTLVSIPCLRATWSRRPVG